ncbi:MAG: hypothetical protein WC415_06130 [Patescibacteria group bacterium]|jgi:hypothetical protein
MPEERVPYDDSNPYEESDPRFESWELRHTEFRDYLLELSDDSSLKHDTKIALKVLINDWCSSNAFMSNQTPPKKSFSSFFSGSDGFNQMDYTRICLEELIELFKASIDPLDKKKNVIYQVIKELENHTLNFTLTRTVGTEREGVVNRIQHTKTTTEMKNWEAQEQQKVDNKKKGFF